MRLRRDQPIAGVDPERARQVARFCGARVAGVADVAKYLKMPDSEAATVLDQLTEAGYLAREERGGQTQWKTTIYGGALSVAKFLRPIPRSRAAELLDGVIERARQYNDDSEKPLIVQELRVFGSYLDPGIDPLGDLDIWLLVEQRDPAAHASDVALDYAASSGRVFSTIVEELRYPEKELRQLLRARHNHISLHTEDISKMTASWRSVYQGPP